jgi:hypothetical protein
MVEVSVLQTVSNTILQHKLTSVVRAGTGLSARGAGGRLARVEWLGVLLKRELGEISRDQQSMFCEPLCLVRQHLGRSLRAFDDRVAAHVKAALGLSLTPHEFVLEVRQSHPRLR